MTFDLRVFRPHVEVKLPLTHDALTLVAGSAKLDGGSIEAVWPESQRALAVPVDQPGVYRLELGFEPVLRSEGGMTGFELAIPPLPEAALTVATVGDPAAVEVSGAAARSRQSNPKCRSAARANPNCGPTSVLATASASAGRTRRICPPACRIWTWKN